MGTKFIVLSSVEYVMSQNLKRTIVRKIKVRKKFQQFFCEPQNFHQMLISLFSKFKKNVHAERLAYEVTQKI